MAQTSRPWQGTSPGDAGPYSAQQWQILYENIIGLGASRSNVGILLGTGQQPTDPLRVQAQSPATTAIDVMPGAALVQGIAHINTAKVSFTIAANASGNPRIDTLVLRADYALQTVRLAVLQGTPAASPSVPALTQSANVLWEIPLADIAVANAFVTITQANITPRYEWANGADGVYLDSVKNNSGGTLNTGDVVIWDISADRAVTTSTTAGDIRVAGVWQGRTANGSYGRVLTDGIGYVNAGAAVTRGDTLVTNGTVKQVGSSALLATQGELGMALETTSGAGLALAYIRTRRNQRASYQPYAAPIGYSHANAYATVLAIAAVSGSLIVPITLSGPMLLQDVRVLNGDTTGVRTWRWDLYADFDNNANTLPRIATCSAPETFTASAASVRTITASGAPVFLSPGNYWLVFQNTHATNTFGLNVQGVVSAFQVATVKTKTTGSTNGATLDIVTGWVAGFNTPAIQLRGRAAGDTVAW